MFALVSVTGQGETTRLRRYELNDRRLICTHDGRYDPGGVTPMNVGYYFDSGAPQDRVAQPSRRRSRSAPPTAA